VVTSPPTRRIRSLDGLRGVAALSVLAYHCVMTGTGAPVDAAVPGAAAWSLGWLAGRSPLHLLWDGAFAVDVFFALSGYVLTLGMARAGWLDWVRYYPQRMLRLYLPVVGAILVAGACAALVPRVATPTESGWMAEHVGNSLSNGISGIFLVHNVRLDSVLWSLHWEVIFSLLLPVAVLLATRVGPRLALAVGGLLLLNVAVGVKEASGRLEYLPMFALGASLAGQHERLDALAARWRPAHTASLALAVAGSQVLRWSVMPGISGTSTTFALVTALQAAATLPLLVVVLCSPRLSGLLESRRVQWLGSRSFSIYLVHEPIVVSAAQLLGPHPLEVLGVSLPLALTVATVFWRFVERPSTVLSRRAGDVAVVLVARIARRGAPISGQARG